MKSNRRFRYHLQAFRHLYVLAIEARLLLPRDIDTRTLCYAHITCIFLDPPYKEKAVRLRAPCLLPELNTLKEVINKLQIKIFIHLLPYRHTGFFLLRYALTTVDIGQ